VYSTGQYCLKFGRCAAQYSIDYNFDGVQHRAVIFIDWSVKTKDNIRYKLDGVQHRAVLVIDWAVYSTGQY
jgi:hypothetical protein